jgi:hypothetical protein
MSAVPFGGCFCDEPKTSHAVVGRFVQICPGADHLDGGGFLQRGLAVLVRQMPGCFLFAGRMGAGQVRQVRDGRQQDRPSDGQALAFSWLLRIAAECQDRISET